MSKRILAGLMTIICVFGFVCGATAEWNVTSAHNLIVESILYYGYYGGSAGKKIAGLFESIEKTDPQAAKLWHDIIMMWHETCTGAYEYTNEDVKLDPESKVCIVVLGYELQPDGKPREELISRLNTALECLKRFPNGYILCTGGPTAKKVPEATEGGVMRDWLIAHNVPEERIIAEEASMSTVDNAVLSYDILRERYPDVSSIIIVSSEYHVRLGYLLFEAQRMLYDSENGTSLPRVAARRVCRTGKTWDERRMDMVSLLLLIGEEDLAREVYFETYKKPQL